MTKNVYFKTGYLILLFILTNILSLNAQVDIVDKIYTKDGQILRVIIGNSNDSVYKYRFYGQKNDSVYTIAKANIDSIMLKSGIWVNKQKLKLPKPPRTTPYLDIELGTLTLGGDGLGILGVADVGVGVALKNNVGFGVSYIGWHAASSCCATNASGVGAQLRVKSNKWFMLKLDVGGVLKAYYGDDGPYRFEYNYKKSGKVFFRISPTFRLGNFTTGLTLVSTNGQINDNYEYDTGKFIGEAKFSVASLSLALGLTFPR